ncbi:MAG: hypothetical protein IKR91_06195, partial [Alloprevotella sp.]|nr:hypothetical protein [Alloprevotella sp.]
WKALKWKDPIFTPQNWENCIGFYNGSVCQIISQDREGASNGLSLDHILIDEAKFVDYEKLKNETFQTNRGNEMYFSKCHLHHGLTITCDTATTKKGSWFMNYEKQMNPELVKVIEGLVYLKWQTQQRMKAHPERAKYYQAEIHKIDRDLFVLRKNCLLYCRYPSLFNLAVLGEDFIRRMKRDLPALTFATSIMCKHIGIAKDGFYGSLRESINYYTAPNVAYIESLKFDLQKLQKEDSRMDADCDPNAPLVIAFDANTNINWLVVGQVGIDGKLYVLKSFYVKYNTLDAVVALFNDYYAHHKNRQVYFAFDSTFKGQGYGANTNEDFYILITNLLLSAGWVVEQVYIGNPMHHVDKYHLINRMLVGKATHQVMINQDNNTDLLLSITTAGIYNDKKDKRGEKLAETEEDKLEARTDGSDAFDTLCIAVEKFIPAYALQPSTGFTSYFGG